MYERCGRFLIYPLLFFTFLDFTSSLVFSLFFLPRSGLLLFFCLEEEGDTVKSKSRERGCKEAQGSMILFLLPPLSNSLGWKGKGAGESSRETAVI